MKICLLSDTHNKHWEIDQDIPKYVDLIIHAGDFSSHGTDDEVDDFVDWFANFPARHKVFICGNHEIEVEKDRMMLLECIKGTGIHYLEHSSCVVEGFKIWGSPATPRFFDWAWNYDDEIADVWKKIPDGTDIVVTHGPMYKAGDYVERGENVGCPYLARELGVRVMPKLHVCGHIHGGYGKYEVYCGDGAVLLSVNASSLNERYEYTNKPIVLELTK